MDVSKLSDEELNRAMIWLNLNGLVIYSDDEGGIRNWGYSIVNYLTDWSLTGPLMVDNAISLTTWDGSDFWAEYETGVVLGAAHDDRRTISSPVITNPLRAICECCLIIALNK